MHVTLMPSPDLAPFPWQVEDSDTTLEGICDKPKGASRWQGVPSIHGKETLAGGGGDLFSVSHTERGA